jgi:repressor LexA
MLELTDPQASVLGYIREAIGTGRPPSLVEISDRFGWASGNSARAHVKALIRKGYLERQPGARGLRLLGFPAPPELENR